MKKNVFKGLAIFIMLIAALQSIAQQKQFQILVGPNIQVSTDGNFGHAEMMFAANPKDPDNIIGGAITFPNGGLTPPNLDAFPVKVYVSKDGGNRWNDISFPEHKYGGADPQLAFGIHGTAYFASFNNLIGNYDKDSNFFFTFRRSIDGGETWDNPLNLGDNFYGLPNALDHPQLIVDHTFKKFAGRIYLSGMSSEEKLSNSKKTTYRQILWLMRSDDDGKSFIGPTKIITTEDFGSNVTQLLVSSKGVLFFTYSQWYSNKSDPNYFEGMDAYVVSSKDGGISFSSPKKIARQNSNKVIQLTFPQYAIDNKGEKYKDRIYCVFSDSQKGKYRVMLTYSKDEGNTWSKPKLIDPSLPKNACQYQPAIQVNPQGIVGIRWYDTRGEEWSDTIHTEGFNEYFTASIDGGETFLPSVKVSTKASKLFTNRTNEPARLVWRRSVNKDSIILGFTSKKMGPPNGGDYMQFITDAEGVFHDFWADGRDGGAYQIYTSNIKVVQPGDKEDKHDIKIEKEISRVSTKPIQSAMTQISRYIYLKTGLSSYDTITNILSIPVSIKNISDKPIYGPIKLQITKIDTSKGKNNIPVILNLNDNKSSVNSQFDYTLNAQNVLLPNAETETVMWRFNVKMQKTVLSLSKEEMEYFRTDKNYLMNYISDTISELHINVMGYLEE